MTDPTPITIEHEPRIVDELVVLDLDRTLINSSKVAELVFTALARQGIDASHIDRAIAYVEAQAGNSFFLFDYIKEEFSEELLETIKGEIINDELLDELRQDLLCLGADKLIYALEGQDTPFVILTYGEPDYQEFKIELFRLLVGRNKQELPAMITNTKNKSEWAVNEWFGSDSNFGEVPLEVVGESLLVRTVTVVDDKVGNLQSPDDRVGGVLVDNRINPAPGVASTAELADVVASGVRLAEVAQL